MAAELERCFDFLRALGERLAERRAPFRFGTALFNDSLPKVWDLNYLVVDAEPASAEELAAEAERLHVAAGHAHRKLGVSDEHLGECLRPGLEALGWETGVHVIMAHRRAPDRAADTSGVREVSEDELQPVRRRAMLTEPWAANDPDAVPQVLAAQYLVDSAVHTRRFAAFAGDEVASYCELYTESGTAQIENVMTLEEHRNHGLARAVVTKALEAARGEGADLVFLVAEEDDWPKGLYAKLGFDTVGRWYWFQRTTQTRLQHAIQRLLDETGASRVTLRRDVADQFFPIVHEALAPGAKSIKDGAGIDLRGQPVVQRLEDTAAQVVQDDCVAAYDNPDFHAMLEAYGGLRAQIVTPVLEDGHLVAIVSLHQCGRTRVWMPSEIALAAETADRVGELLRA